MVERGGVTFQNCTRSQADWCWEFVKQHHDELGLEWMGCGSPAFINTSYPYGMIPAFSTSISVVASYSDSETMDITVTYKKSYCDKTVRSWKDVQIVRHESVEDGRAHSYHSATVEFGCLTQPSDVPIVDATEKGGKKELTHPYR
jgi:hypothetical protein